MREKRANCARKKNKAKQEKKKEKTRENRRKQRKEKKMRDNKFETIWVLLSNESSAFRLL